LLLSGTHSLHFPQNFHFWCCQSGRIYSGSSPDTTFQEIPDPTLNPLTKYRNDRQISVHCTKYGSVKFVKLPNDDVSTPDESTFNHKAAGHVRIIMFKRSDLLMDPEPAPESIIPDPTDPSLTG
jgi:hypothetical protein